jgi:hypothetical protein
MADAECAGVEENEAEVAQDQRAHLSAPISYTILRMQEMASI